MILSVGCGGNGRYRQSTFRDVNVDVLIPSERVDSFVLADIARLPFRDKAFDQVLASHVLEHVENLDEALREINRVSSSVDIRLPRWISFNAMADLGHRWFYYRGRFHRNNPVVHVLFYLVFGSRYIRWGCGKVFNNPRYRFARIDQEVRMTLKC